MQYTIRINHGVARHPLHRMKTPIDLELAANEQIAIVGPNGGGKTELVHTLIGKYPILQNDIEYDFTPRLTTTVYENIKYITFRDTFTDTGENYYYQQRWNSQEVELFPTVANLLPEAKDKEQQAKLYTLFDIKPLLDKEIILLSSGELRKFQIVRALLSNPRVLIMDNPFIGLDAPTRDQLRHLLAELVTTGNLQLILVLSKSDDIPSFITHVVEVKEMTCHGKVTMQHYLATRPPLPKHVLTEEKRQAILNLPKQTNDREDEHIIDLHDISIRYGKRTILNKLNWSVMRGEKWALSGKNGSGKSTLLSLICADNPQAYACDISLFGQKRGTGESIWEIKKHIGYVSPEMHRTYLKNIPTIEIVASGLHDSIGLYKRPQREQMDVCAWWMDIFGIGHLKERGFLSLSSGEQRLALLARAFVKDPQLLILDEPLHGLDLSNRQLARDIIETFCTRPNKTLVIVTHYEEELPAGITHHLRLKRN